MSEKKILIITDELDPHADNVILRLSELGHEPVRLHLRELPQSSQISITLADGYATGRISTSTRSLRMSDIGAVWFRKPKWPIPADGLSEREAAFGYEELRYAAKGAWSLLDCYWMSHPANINTAENKLHQLKTAMSMGFETPRTLVTATPSEVRDLFTACNGKLIYKTLTNPAVEAAFEDNPLNFSRASPTDHQPLFAYTTVITEDILANHADNISYAPGLFQEHIPKKAELRVTIIEDEVFVAQIDSQAHERTSLDWRHYDVPANMTKGCFPKHMADRCIEFMRRYKLKFSAMDFIITHDDRYIFLESNPNGQWLFVEVAIPELEMTDKIAQCLLKECRSQSSG